MSELGRRVAEPGSDGGENDEATALVRRRLRDDMATKAAMVDAGQPGQVVEVARHLVEALRRGGKVLFFGNGGSSMDAGHLAAELLGRFYLDRAPLPAVSLPDATAAMTAIGNDYEYAEVFARQLRALGRPGDVAVGLSTSGSSANVVRALDTARELGMFSVVLTGAGGGAAADLADVCIAVPTTDTPRVQEACLHLGHTICELVERDLFAPS